MPKQIKLFSLLLLVTFPVYFQGSIGVPCGDKGWYARNLWDMIIYHHTLYAGCGDYGSNKGPVDVWSYTQASGWVNEYTVDEEAIGRFDLLGDTLIIPGTDAMEDWSFGNWYELTPDGWLKHRDLPNAIHVFDMIDYDGLWFAGFGVAPGSRAVALSSDQGQTWQPQLVPVGAQRSDKSCTDQFVSTPKRVTNFFTLGGELYAATGGYYLNDCDNGQPVKVARYELMRWDGSGFQTVDLKPFIVDNQQPMISPTSFHDAVVYIGRFYPLADTSTVFSMGVDLAPREIPLPNCSLPLDMTTGTNALYVLCNTQQANSWRVSVQMTCDLEQWREVFAANEVTFGRSIAVDAGTLYYSLGGEKSDGREIRSSVGEIKQVDQIPSQC